MVLKADDEVICISEPFIMPDRAAHLAPARWTGPIRRYGRPASARFVLVVALVEMVAGNLVKAEDSLRGGYRRLEEMGGNGPRANVAAMLARVRLLQNQLDDAEELTSTCERLAAPDQADVQIKWRSIRAIAMARRGEPSEAERLAREAVYLAGQTDQLESRAESCVDLAEVLLLGGRGREAGRELDRAITLYKEKGSDVGERNALRLRARTRS